MDKAQEKEKLESLIKKLNLKTSKSNAKPNKGDRYKIRGENSRDSLWVQVQGKKFVVGLSGDRKSNEHKKIYDYIGRDYDHTNTQNKQWFFDSFNEIENIVYCYAGVKKENMEQEFRQWLGDQTTQKGNDFDEGHINYLCTCLRETIPNWGQVNHLNLFTIKDVNIIQELHERCSKNGGDLYELNINVGKGNPSNALKRYKQFLEFTESAELPNQGSKNMDAKPEEAISVLKNKKQIILQGSPGTGKTRLAKEIAYYLIKGEALSNDEKERQEQLVFLIQTKQYKLIQFRPAYSYEDFVRGIVATTAANGDVNYEVQNKVLAEMAENAIDNLKEDYVLIIDEINRANLSSVLGELIYALEYRGESVESMYEYEGRREIILPENLYIIGTMNTADRSVGHVDYAIRRRFAFVDVDTDESVIPDNAKPLFNEVKALFDVYLSEEFELTDVMIGHSYFLKGNLDLALEYEIKPILQEYRKDGVLVDREDKIKDKIEALKIED